jgi:hypothetical protein
MSRVNACLRFQVMLCIGAISITTFIFSFAITAMVLTHEVRVLHVFHSMFFHAFPLHFGTKPT